MPKYNSPKLEQIDLEIRRLMVREPDISGRRIAVLLKHDKDFIIKRKKKIDKANRINIERSLIEKDLAELENIYKSMALDLYTIIANGANERIQILAFNSLWKTKRELISSKMDAGIFKRNLGKLEIESPLNDEQESLLKKAIDYATYRENKRGNVERPKADEGDSKD